MKSAGTTVTDLRLTQPPLQRRFVLIRVDSCLTRCAGVEQRDTARFPLCSLFHNFQNLSPAGRSLMMCRSRSIAAIGSNFSPGSIDSSQLFVTFLPYGSDNYFSSDKKARGMDRTGRTANGRVPRPVHPLAPRTGARRRS